MKNMLNYLQKYDNLYLNVIQIHASLRTLLRIILTNGRKKEDTKKQMIIKSE